MRAKAVAATEQVHQAVHIAELARDKAPAPGREKAGHGMQAARANRTPLLTAAGALIALLFIRRARRHRSRAMTGPAKLQGVQSILWAAELMEQGLNPTCRIKGGDVLLGEGE
ncbi:hypothetical protein ACH4HG_22350 [Streptomyces coeruleorubidus]|uniref:hypothetical protein n=1 Tax=Streptomyces coeruleorubidus TaxID=116188 RepID=UPI00378D70C0